MARRISAGSVLVAVVALMLAGGAAVVSAASSTEVVTPSNVGVDWFTNDTRAGGTVDFVSGPATPPAGTGSLQMTTTDSAGGSSQAKAQLFNYDYIGTELSDIEALSYYATATPRRRTRSPRRFR